MDSAHIDDLDLESLEANLRTGALRVAARFLEDKLNNDQSDYAGKRLPCIFCGQEAHYVNRRSKTFTTTLGDINLERATITVHSAATAGVREIMPWVSVILHCRQGLPA